MRLSRPGALTHERRQLLKVVKRKKRAEKVQRSESVLAATGIRKLRREPVFITSPNIFSTEGGRALTSGEPAYLKLKSLGKRYVCKKEFSTVHHFYDRLCTACAEENFAKRTELGGPEWPRRPAHRGSREDRLSGGDQAPSRRRASHRHHALSARLGGPLRSRARFPRVVRPARDLRPRPATYAERRSVLQGSAGDGATTGLHHQQRVPDRPPPGRLLRAHEGDGDSGADFNARARPKACSAATRIRTRYHAVVRKSDLALLASRPRRKATAFFRRGSLDQDLQQVDFSERNSWRLMLAEVVFSGTARKCISSTQWRRSSSMRG